MSYFNQFYGVQNFDSSSSSDDSPFRFPDSPVTDTPPRNQQRIPTNYVCPPRPARNAPVENYMGPIPFEINPELEIISPDEGYGIQRPTVRGPLSPEATRYFLNRPSYVEEPLTKNFGAHIPMDDMAMFEGDNSPFRYGIRANNAARDSPMNPSTNLSFIRPDTPTDVWKEVKNEWILPPARSPSPTPPPVQYAEISPGYLAMLKRLGMGEAEIAADRARREQERIDAAAAEAALLATPPRPPGPWESPSPPWERVLTSPPVFNLPTPRGRVPVVTMADVCARRPGPQPPRTNLDRIGINNDWDTFDVPDYSPPEYGIRNFGQVLPLSPMNEDVVGSFNEPLPPGRPWELYRWDNRNILEYWPYVETMADANTDIRRIRTPPGMVRVRKTQNLPAVPFPKDDEFGNIALYSGNRYGVQPVPEGPSSPGVDPPRNLSFEIDARGTEGPRNILNEEQLDQYALPRFPNRPPPNRMTPLPPPPNNNYGRLLNSIRQDNQTPCTPKAAPNPAPPLPPGVFIIPPTLEAIAEESPFRTPPNQGPAAGFLPPLPRRRLGPRILPANIQRPPQLLCPPPGPSIQRPPQPLFPPGPTRPVFRPPMRPNLQQPAPGLRYNMDVINQVRSLFANPHNVPGYRPPAPRLPSNEAGRCATAPRNMANTSFLDPTDQINQTNIIQGEIIPPQEFVPTTPGPFIPVGSPTRGGYIGTVPGSPSPQGGGQIFMSPEEAAELSFSSNSSGDSPTFAGNSPNATYTVAENNPNATFIVSPGGNQSPLSLVSSGGSGGVLLPPGRDADSIALIASTVLRLRLPQMVADMLRDGRAPFRSCICPESVRNGGAVGALEGCEAPAYITVEIGCAPPDGNRDNVENGSASPGAGQNGGDPC